jgi:hypothetical protein
MQHQMITKNETGIIFEKYDGDYRRPMVVPSSIPSQVLGKNPPSDKINIGQIGCGRLPYLDLPL